MYSANHEFQALKDVKLIAARVTLLFVYDYDNILVWNYFKLHLKFNRLVHVFVEYILILVFYFCWDFVFLFV